MACRKILLFSDGSQIFSALHRFFTEKMHHVKTFYNSRAAIEALSIGEYHSVIARLSRDRLDCPAVLKAAQEINPEIKVILLKGDHEINSAIEAFQLEGDLEIFIPCGWAGLHRLVN